MMAMLTYLVGSVPLMAWMCFLFLGAPELVHLGLNELAIYSFDAFLCLTFFIQHSTMVRQAFKKWLTGVFPEEYSGAIYTLSSGTVLLIQIVLWQKSAYMVAHFQGVLSGLLYAVFVLSIVGFFLGTRALESFDAFGIHPILHQPDSLAKQPKMSFTIRGPYRWMRHPLYFFCLIFIWSCPVLTGDRLLFNLLWTGWIIVAVKLEERDLVAEFGKVYQDYQKNVPMLIPWRIPPRSS